MLKKFASVTLIVLVLCALGVRPTSARQAQDKEARRIEKVRENVQKLGTGAEARAEVRLNDNRKIKGYIKEAGEKSFVLVEEKTGTFTIIDYSEVKQLKGKNRLTAAKVGITIAKGALIVAAVAGIFTLLLALTLPRT